MKKKSKERSRELPARKTAAKRTRRNPVLPPPPPVQVVEEDDGTFDPAAAEWVEPPPIREAVASREGVAELLVFRVGEERFGLPLAAVEEALEAPVWHPIPDAPGKVLGVISLRGRLITVCSPLEALGVPLSASRPPVLVLRSGTVQVALAVDALQNVLRAEMPKVRNAPGVGDPDGILLGVVHSGGDLVALLDPDALALACSHVEVEIA